MSSEMRSLLAIFRVLDAIVTRKSEGLVPSMVLPGMLSGIYIG